MKNMNLRSTMKCALLAGLLGGLGTLNSRAQSTFNSGSDGSYGAMDITTNTTLDLPANGIFNCTTITIASNATLSFTPNALNTPVYLLAQGDVTINGTIDVSGSAATALLGGAGGPGGFAGGNPGNMGLPAGDGHGPGAGRAGPGWASADSGAVGSASYGTRSLNYQETTNTGSVYGSPLLIPLVGGSGGGGVVGGAGGNGGGGAILLASNTRIDVYGTIRAASPWIAAGYINVGCGSGGAIRLVAPIVGGVGYLDASGGVSCCALSRMVGGAGRVRIDCIDRRSLALTTSGFVIEGGSWSPVSSQVTVGANMVAIPTNAPRLDITQAGGNTIPLGASAPVFFTLPWGSATNQTVTVQANNFGGVVPIRVVLTPDNGPSSSYDTNIDNTVSPASVTVPVVVPVNVQVQVNAWTR